MRRKLLLLLAPFIFFACQQEKGYKIEGQLQGLNDGQVILKHKQDGQWSPLDTTKDSIKVLFPTPGTPVIPTRTELPA